MNARIMLVSSLPLTTPARSAGALRIQADPQESAYQWVTEVHFGTSSGIRKLTFRRQALSAKISLPTHGITMASYLAISSGERKVAPQMSLGQ